MPRTYAACLIDVFNTVLSVDNPAYLAALAESAGIDLDSFVSATEQWSPRTSVGSLTIRQALEETLRVCGSAASPEALARLVAEEARLLHEHCTIHDETVPFLEALRERGVRSAFVSNCADNTRPLLDAYGLTGLVDELVLSCEVGSSKPAPGIYAAALERLGVRAEEAVFVDDEPAFCDGARSLGIRAFRLDRDGRGEVSRLHDLLEWL